MHINQNKCLPFTPFRKKGEFFKPTRFNLCSGSNFKRPNIASTTSSDNGSSPSVSDGHAKRKAKILSNTFSGVSSEKGGTPVTNSYKHTPNPHQSTADECDFLNNSSGAK